MKKVVLGILVLVLLAVGAAAVYITTIDWNQHKDKIAEQFYQLTGKTVRFDGRLSFKIFPSPYLNAADAKIYNDKDSGGEPLMEIKNAVAELALMPLLSGEFHVKKMLLDGVSINIDWDKGGLSWQNDLSPDQRQMMEDTTMVLNSVSLKNAVVNFKAPESGIDLQLTDLSGEVMAQSIFGPFRIEGNYIKGSTPEGFAVSIGKLSDSFATTLNMVVTHPQSESYVRFDGSFNLNNRALNGNVIVDSQHLSDFINANFVEAKMPAEYNQPIATGFDIALTTQNLELSNIVVKYGNTQGAGVLKMPLEYVGKPEIKTSFDFSDLELDPIVKFMLEKIDYYKEENYEPDFPFDLDAEIRAVRALYQGQGVKDLEIAVTAKDDTIEVAKLAMVLPGNTIFNIQGSVYPYQDEIYFQADTNISTNDLMQALQWFKIEPKANAVSVYKKMLATAKLSGNYGRIQISPYKVTLDKSTVTGEAGIVLGDRNDFMLVVNADTINFDNYIGSLPEEEKRKSWAERIAYRFSRLGVLNNFDLVLNAKADMVIYESMPFEKVDFKGNILNGEMEIEYGKVDQVANTSIDVKGKLGGFGASPQMTDFQYVVKSNDIASLINKLELKVPDLDYKKFNLFEMSGAINGGIDNFGINTSMSLGQLSGTYQGTVVQTGTTATYNGDLTLKHPDFATLLSDLRVKYEPSVKSLGLLNMKMHLEGEKENMKFSGVEANIGYTTVSGSGYYEEHEKRPNIIGDFSINKLETEKFLPKSQASGLISGQQAPAIAAFLTKPFLGREKIDYSPYIYFDFKGNLKVGELSYKSYVVKDAQFGLDLVDGTVSVRDFKGLYNNTPFMASMSLYMREAPSIVAEVKIDDANVNDFVLGGKTYNLRGGKFSTRFDISSKADSEDAFISNLKGKGEFTATAATANGVDLTAIYNDLIKREVPEGLVEQVKANIGKGQTLFDNISGRIIIENGEFSLADTVIQGANADIKIYGDGNFSDWTMNTVFNVRYQEPKYLPEFSFSLKNGMDNPLVDVNVSSLFKLYQNREEQREAAAAAEAEAERNYWLGLVDGQRKTANDLVLSTREKLEKDIDMKMDGAFDADSINQYNQLKQEIAQILAKLVETIDTAAAEEPGNEAIEKMKQANQQALKEIEPFAGRVNDIYLADLKKAGQDAYNKVNELHNQIKQDIFSYHKEQEKYRERLGAIVTDYTPDADERFQELKKKVDDEIAAADAFDGEIKQAHLSNQSNMSAAENETYNQNMKSAFDRLEKIKQSLSENVAVLDKYAAEVVQRAEDAYQKKLEEEENQRRLEENTGSISIKKTGQTFTVTRDIEEIKTAEEEISNEGVRVLDFSKEKVRQPTSSPASNENVVKKGRNNR